MTKHSQLLEQEKRTAPVYDYSVNVTLQSHFEGITEKVGKLLSNVN